MAEKKKKRTIRVRLERLTKSQETPEILASNQKLEELRKALDAEREAKVRAAKVAQRKRDLFTTAAEDVWSDIQKTLPLVTSAIASKLIQEASSKDVIDQALDNLLTRLVIPELTPGNSGGGSGGKKRPVNPNSHLAPRDRDRRGDS